METKKTTISQKDNYAGNFGLILRSSAIFYAINNKKMKTTVSFLNYWILKRDIKVTVIINLRKMNGALVSREFADFSNGMVFNYSPKYKDFEGSIEIEVFSLENMVIPYAAVMVIYESKESISMVHSYARIYSLHEIEEKRTISNGRESCWTIRDSQSMRSFCVMHNGSSLQKEQTSRVTITTSANERHYYDIIIPELNAYASHRINLNEEINGISDILKGEAGNASINFELNNSFTRLLVGNERIDNGEFQITHSNFNYLEHLSDSCDEDNTNAYMHILKLPEKKLKVVVYPDMAPGKYIIKDGNMEIKIQSKEMLRYIPTSKKQIFSSENKILPTRIVTALSGGNDNKLPFECSLGVFHNKRPPKRMHWGSAVAQKKLSGSLYISVLDDIYGPIEDAKIIARLYSSVSPDYIEKEFCGIDVNTFESGVLFSDIFIDSENFLSGEYGYYTLFSEYGGLFVYSSVENENGSFTLEHSF
jgi:hypothetical protein